MSYARRFPNNDPHYFRTIAHGALFLNKNGVLFAGKNGAVFTRTPCMGSTFRCRKTADPPNLCFVTGGAMRIYGHLDSTIQCQPTFNIICQSLYQARAGARAEFRTCACAHYTYCKIRVVPKKRIHDAFARPKKGPAQINRFLPVERFFLNH